MNRSNSDWQRFHRQSAPLSVYLPPDLPGPRLPGPLCSAPGPVKDVTARCLFNESSLEEVMKSALTPLTTSLISCRTHAAGASLLPARGRCRHLTARSYISTLLTICFCHLPYFSLAVIPWFGYLVHVSHSGLTVPTNMAGTCLLH